jgi:hypothetical protein
LVLSLLAGACTADQRSDATVPPTTQVAAPTTVAPVPTTTTTAPPTTRLEEQRLWAFPGPEHYEGDVLTLQLPLGDFGTHELGPTTLTIDGETAPVRAILESDPLLGWYVVFPDAFDTAGEVGRHEVIVTAEIDGSRRRVGTGIEVLSASRRPAQESTATWDFVQTECCVLRYLTDSAAARDLDAVAELLDDKAAFVEKRFERPLPEVDITLIDVLWGNGGYSGTEVVVSYLDRDFGPRDAEVVGTTLAHELTHWMTDDLEQSILPWPLEEGIAVYVTPSGTSCLSQSSSTISTRCSTSHATSRRPASSIISWSGSVGTSSSSSTHLPCGHAPTRCGSIGLPRSPSARASPSCRLVSRNGRPARTRSPSSTT